MADPDDHRVLNGSLFALRLKVYDLAKAEILQELKEDYPLPDSSGDADNQDSNVEQEDCEFRARCRRGRIRTHLVKLNVLLLDNPTLVEPLVAGKENTLLPLKIWPKSYVDIGRKCTEGLPLIQI